ncbi:nucleotidyltransferase family protein [Thiohalorhabdus sp.]|uniref:nucleotidyltransferase family protein n=1 Tax=Thiohalorhabdus sp. TaxID=3094134 RepID=UPI002FC28199
MAEPVTAKAVQDLPQRPRTVVREAAAAIRAELGEATRVVWFGSWPRGDARQRSDVDLAMDRDAAITPAELARARERVEDLSTLYSVGLLARDEVDERLRQEIEREGIEL